MALTRLENWDTGALHEFLIERADRPFTWGENDCALFVADGILAMTGIDIAADFRGRYSNEEDAFATVRMITGGSTLEDAAAWCAMRHGLDEWPGPLFAQRGDMAIVENEGRLISGLVHLSGRHVVTVGESGLRRFPITAIVRAWHV
jgi:hypothetical protein